jgi:hypothetical protein
MLTAVQRGSHCPYFQKSCEVVQSTICQPSGLPLAAFDYDGPHAVCFCVECHGERGLPAYTEVGHSPVASCAGSLALLFVLSHSSPTLPLSHFPALPHSRTPHSIPISLSLRRSRSRSLILSLYLVLLRAWMVHGTLFSCPQAGSPPQEYAVPVGWARVGVVAGVVQVRDHLSPIPLT